MSAAGVQQDHALDAMRAGYDVVIWNRSRALARANLEGLIERAEARGIAVEARLGHAELRAPRGPGRIRALIRSEDRITHGFHPTIAYTDDWTRLP